MDSPPHTRNLYLILIAGILFLFLITACLSPSEGLSQTTPHPWANALRALDPADVSTPSNDLTAVYLRQHDDDLQIRIDLLDFQFPGQLSLDIRIVDATAPEMSPLNIQIPSEINSSRITLDPLLATVIINVPLSELSSRPRVDVSTPEDEITGLRLDGPIPNQTAPLLLTFYDTFAGRIPAEALRSWDGAHTGPRGERHGLKHLLDAVEEYQIPVVLLDLKEPENLSALDTMGVLLQIRRMMDEKLLVLPEVSSNADLTGLCETCQVLGLPVSDLAYYSTQADHQFTFLEDTTYLYHPLFSKTIYIPIAKETETSQPTPNGPSLEIRRDLLEIALNSDEKDILVLGGSFPETTWGSPDMVGATLAYFASRPYIQILGAENLLEFPTRSGNIIIPQLMVQTTPPIQSILEYAKSWAGTFSATPIYHCQPNLLNESSPDCVMANHSYFAIFDAQNASLAYLFSVERDAIPPYLHQLIGPSWQVAPGIDVYPGAFADDKIYEPIIEENSLIFTAVDGARVKTFTLNEIGLEVTYRTQEPITVQIPLLVDPWTRFTPGWAENYMQQNTPGGIAWGLDHGPIVRIQTEGALTMRAFNEALDLLASPENPDFEYPPGHSVPFPMAIVEVEMQDGYVLRLERLP